jgi:hypothetical protein
LGLTSFCAVHHSKAWILNRDCANLSQSTSRCHNLSFGLATKAKEWKGEGWECNLGVTFTLLKVRENVKDWAHTLPNGQSPRFLNNYFKGQN